MVVNGSSVFLSLGAREFTFISAAVSMFFVNFWFVKCLYPSSGRTLEELALFVCVIKIGITHTHTYVDFFLVVLVVDSSEVSLWWVSECTRLVIPSRAFLWHPVYIVYRIIGLSVCPVCLGWRVSYVFHGPLIRSPHWLIPSRLFILIAGLFIEWTSFWNAPRSSCVERMKANTVIRRGVQWGEAGTIKIFSPR